MKKLAKSLLMLLVGMFMLPAIAVAQQMPPIPVDTTVRIGKLPNGLTYYIQHNEYPKGQADFYIAQKSPRDYYAMSVMQILNFICNTDKKFTMVNFSKRGLLIKLFWNTQKMKGAPDIERTYSKRYFGLCLLRIIFHLST